MRVLFVASGNIENKIKNHIVERQAESLKVKNIIIEHFYITDKGVTGYLKSISKIRHLLKNSKFDIVHAHYGWSGLVSLLTFTRVKKVISFMGDDLIGTINRKSNYTLFGKIVTKFNIFLAKHFYDYSIIKSENLKEKLKSVMTAELIPNGVDVKIFSQKDKYSSKKTLGWSPDKKYVIFVSNPERGEKNFALAQASTELLNIQNLELFVVRNVTADKLNLYYNAADCLILTSIHEGSPNVIKEAMACGCPIVSTDVGDVEWILGNTDGCYLTSFEPQDVACKIKLALEFSEKSGRTKGRERILELGLDSETIASRIIEIYKKVTT